MRLHFPAERRRLLLEATKTNSLDIAYLVGRITLTRVPQLPIGRSSWHWIVRLHFSHDSSILAGAALFGQLDVVVEVVGGFAEWRGPFSTTDVFVLCSAALRGLDGKAVAACVAVLGDLAHFNSLSVCALF